MIAATFKGDPSPLDTAVGLMYSLRIRAQELMAAPNRQRGAAVPIRGGDGLGMMSS